MAGCTFVCHSLPGGTIGAAGGRCWRSTMRTFRAIDDLMRHIAIGLIGCWLVSCLPASAQSISDTSMAAQGPKVQATIWEAAAHYGTIFAHSEAVQNTAGAHPRGIALAYTWQRRDKGAVDLCNCYPRQGVVLSLFNFDNQVLGRGAMAGWMLEPTYRLGSRLHMHVRGVAGAAWLSNPFDSLRNPTNQSYSTGLSAWLAVGLGFSYPVSPKFRIKAMAHFQHTSNGGMRQPNKGVNMPTLSLGALYEPNPMAFYKGARSKEKYWRQQPWQKDIALLATAKRSVNANGSSTRRPIVGLQAQAAKQVGHINALLVGAELYHDGFTRTRLDADGLDGTSALRAGIMGGHRFLLGRIGFSQQVGIYVYNPSPYDGVWFHRWGLDYRLTQKVYAGVNLKAHRHVADFFDFRVGFRW